MISREEVIRIAKLARLEFSEEELEQMRSHLARILEYMNLLAELDTSDVPPTSHVLELKDVVRKDTPRKWLNKDEALANAPERTEDFFKVPRVLEEH